MPSYDEFESTGTTYSFSKGPKSLYYGNGDMDLVGVVLNAPQTDDDDEWGGTERIALERLTDKISDLVEDVQDPHSAGTGLLADVVKLNAIVDTTTPKITLGSIVINGSTNILTVGTCSLKCTLLTFGTDFGIIPAANQYAMNYLKSSVVLLDNGIGTSYVDIRVGSPIINYRFSTTAFGPTTAGINIVATGNVGGINGAFTGAVTAASVASSGVLSATTATLTGLVVNGTATHAGIILPDAPGTRDIGDTVVRWATIYGVAGNFTGVVTSAGVTATTLSIGTITATGTATMQTIIPSAPSAYNLGSAGLTWATIYGDAGSFAGNLTAVNLIGSTDIYTTAWFDYSATATPSIVGWDVLTTVKIYYKRIGKTGIVEFVISGTASAGLTSASFPLPTVMKAKNVPPMAAFSPIKFVDNNTPSTTPGMIKIDYNTNTAILYTTWDSAGGLWTTGAVTKGAAGTIVYETD